MKLTFIPFIFLLSMTHAATGDEDFCSTFLGKFVKFEDCIKAYNDVPKTVKSDLPTEALTEAKLFSKRPNTPERFKLPQTFTSGTCTIDIDMADGVDLTASTWDFQREAVMRAITYCVQIESIGGRIFLKGTTITVRQTASRKKSKPTPEDNCALVPKHSDLYRCLKDAEAAAAAATKALNTFDGHMTELTYKFNKGAGTSGTSGTSR